MVQRWSDSAEGDGDYGAGNVNFLKDRVLGVFASKEELLERSTLAGRIGPVFRKFLLSKEQIQAIVGGIRSVAQISDVTLLIIVGWVLVPLMGLWYDRIMAESVWRGTGGNYQAATDSVGGDGGDDFGTAALSSVGASEAPRQFDRTKIYHLFNALSEIAKLATLVYAVDMVKIFLLGAGFDIPKGNNLTHVFMYIVYTVWGFHRVSLFKHYILKNLVKRTGAEPGRIRVIDRLTDVALSALAVFVLFEILNVEMGVTVKGVVAVGSVWTLVVSLAAKEIVSNFLHGILLSASDHIYEGDLVRTSKSGFQGTVARMGWLETVLQGTDDVTITVPNAQLKGDQVANLSRNNVCQVHQTLRFLYSDADKLPKLVYDIKRGIRASCPSVITDGSRPFRCYWTNFQSDHLEVVVDAHFRIRPVGDAYFENRQRVLQAIDRAVKDNMLTYQGT